MSRSIRILLLLAIGIALIAACGTPQEPVVEYELDITLAGTGTGTVVSAPEGIDTADGDFDAAFAAGTVVTLTATATGGSSFGGFSFPAGAAYDCEEGSAASTCVLTMDEAKSVTATFVAPAATADLVVVINAGGDAAGSVVSMPAGIDTAGGVDEFSFEVGTEVTLTATVDAEHFAGWTGGQCDGIKELTCTLTIVTAQPPVTANFNEASTVTVRIAERSDTAEEFLTASSSNPTRWPLGYTYIRSDDLEIAYDPQHGPQAIGLRFTGVTVPAKAVILSAFLGFTAFDSPNTGTETDVAVTITGEASASSTTFVDDPNETGPNPPSFGVTSLTPTDASVPWTITGAWSADVEYSSADTGTIVQEIVDLAGWTSGGSLIFIIRPDDEASVAFRRAYSSGNPGVEDKGPTLVVTYVPLP